MVGEEEGEGEGWGDPMVSAGRRLAQILHTVPYSEKEVEEKCQSLRPEDGQFWKAMHVSLVHSLLPSQTTAGWRSPLIN